MVTDENLIQAVWEKGRGMLDKDASEWRKDECGAWLHRQQYNNENSEYGWKILNVKPGEPDEPHNLQPFHWKNDFDIANNKPQCHVTADRVGLSPTQRIDMPRNTNA